MERPVSPPMPTVGRTDSNSSYWRSSAFMRERRLWRIFLVAVCVMIIVSMVISLIFIAHYYFHEWGGQGFVKARQLTPDYGSGDNQQSCLPLRSMARPTGGMRRFDRSEAERSESVLPFYPCGDQQNSCGAYNQENICCPVGMSCHPTPFTNSGTFCCNSTASGSNCQASQSKAPKCPLSSFECAAVVGGGCCSNGTACSANGCIEFDGSGTPPPITSVYTTTTVQTTASSAVESSSGGQEAVTDIDLMVTTIATRVTIVMGGAISPTATIHKQGEEMQKAEGASLPKIGWPWLYVACSPHRMLVFVALGMMFL